MICSIFNKLVYPTQRQIAQLKLIAYLLHMQNIPPQFNCKNQKVTCCHARSTRLLFIKKYLGDTCFSESKRFSSKHYLFFPAGFADFSGRLKMEHWPEMDY